MNATVHSQPGPELVKVGFELPPADWHEHAVEWLWAEERAQGGWTVRSIPFCVYGVSYGDTVEAAQDDLGLMFAGVIARGGHSTYRVMVLRGEERSFDRFWHPLGELGCTYEGYSDHLYAVDVPPGCGVERVYRLLEEGERLNVWRFEEGHCYDRAH